MTKEDFKIAIIGYGRFGKLLAEILKPFAEILVISHEKINDDKIRQIDYADLKEADWIIPAVPISALREVLNNIKDYLKKDSLVMDVCSVKTYPCQWLREYLPKDVQIIGTHPMFGPDSAKRGLEGLQMILCPIRISDDNLDKLKTILSELKLKIIETTPENHDQQAAISLALVHFIGRGLGKLNIKNLNITSLGFERLLAVNETVENDTWQLFLDMHRFNPFSEKAREDLIESLESLNNKIMEEKTNEY